MQGWSLLERIVSLTFFAVFLIIIIIGAIAYNAVNKGFERVDKLIANVKTATDKTLDEVMNTMRDARGVFQSVQHTVGDLVLIVNNVTSGLFQVTKGFGLKKVDVDNGSHLVTSGDFANTHITANHVDKIHKVIQSSGEHPYEIPTTNKDGESGSLEFTLQRINQISLKAKSYNINWTEDQRTVTFESFEIGNKQFTITKGATLSESGDYQVLLDNVHGMALLNIQFV